MCYYSEILIPATTWINLEIVMPCEISRKWTNIVILLYEAALEKEMATHSSDLAWRIPGMGEPGGLPSMGLHRVRHD